MSNTIDKEHVKKAKQTLITSVHELVTEMIDMKAKFDQKPLCVIVNKPHLFVVTSCLSHVALFGTELFVVHFSSFSEYC